MTVREVLAAAIPADAWGWAAIIVGAWLLLAATGTAGYSLFAGKLKRLRSSRVRRPQYPPPVPPVVVNWVEFLPPVPGSDAARLDAWPQEARSRINAAALQDAMEQERYDRLFDDLIAIEGLQ